MLFAFDWHIVDWTLIQFQFNSILLRDCKTSPIEKAYLLLLATKHRRKTSVYRVNSVKKIDVPCV